jgi:hypothetical protein
MKPCLMFTIVLSARDNDGANGQHANTVSLTTGNASPVAVEYLSTILSGA